MMSFLFILITLYGFVRHSGGVKFLCFALLLFSVTNLTVGIHISALDPKTTPYMSTMTPVKMDREKPTGDDYEENEFEPVDDEDYE